MAASLSARVRLASPPLSMSWARATVFGCLLLGLVSNRADADAMHDPLTEMMVGRIGPYQIGLQLAIHDEREIVDAHYFYYSQRSNIPLTARMEGATVILEGTDGGVFKLHLDPRHPGEAPPQIVGDAFGMSGVWTRGTESLPVEVHADWSRTGVADPLQGDVTDLPDGVFEAKVAKFRDAVLKGDRATAAEFVSYPLSVYGPGRRLRLIRNKREVLAKWSSIFTPPLLKVLQDSPPHEMPVHNAMVSLGVGNFWIGDKGVVTINLP